MSRYRELPDSEDPQRQARFLARVIAFVLVAAAVGLGLFSLLAR